MKAMKTWRAVHVLAAAIVWQLGPMADAQTPPGSTLRLLGPEVVFTASDCCDPQLFRQN
jgi:hypothetical protein